LTVQAGGKRIALFRVDDAVYAIDDACPHMGASLGAGAVEGGVVTCPWHGWRFRVTDGAWVSCPNNRNKTYAVRVEGGQVFVKVE
jgi:nitrite reductase (NADH) small subunit/3-phenylpropionate/trans-cinnamate dioxygenase ferredoxin subunit